VCAAVNLQLDDARLCSNGGDSLKAAESGEITAMADCIVMAKDGIDGLRMAFQHLLYVAQAQHQTHVGG